ncbi:hypothetical protein C8R47DRAFT_321330 [Mycena vitilis]|nr:hypothetical protein C8R47DRAFT_321330 [Mycena vitilis]
MKSCEQWCDVRLVFPIQAFSALIARCGSFPMLRSLHICSKYEIRGALTIPIRDAPLLRTVTLDVISLLSLKTTWEQLSTLDMTEHDPGSKFSALRHCSNLVNLRVTLFTPYFSSRTQENKPPLLTILFLLGPVTTSYLSSPYQISNGLRYGVSSFLTWRYQPKNCAVYWPALLATWLSISFRSRPPPNSSLSCRLFPPL